MHAVFVPGYGGSEVRTWTEPADPIPGPGEAADQAKDARVMVESRSAPCSAEHRAGGLRHANQTQTAETRHNAISNQTRRIPESGKSVPGQAWK
jgi:hypothetical protein